MIAAVRMERRGCCGVCGRQLKDPKWVEAGIGPVCAKKQGIRAQDSPAPAMRESLMGWLQVRSVFTITHTDQETMTIRDDFYERNPTTTVTNDAEAVVDYLLKTGKLGARRLFYYDTEGQLDEITHDGQKFTGFKAGPRPSEEEIEAQNDAANDRALLTGCDSVFELERKDD